MSGTSIGEVNINLRLSLAQFKQDTKEGTQAASRGVKDMANEMKQGTGEAKATLALLGEEIGVSIPRHIRGLIASVPGVGAALNAAFTSVAVIALIEVIVKIVEKLDEFKKRAQEVSEAMRKTEETGSASLRKIEEETLSLEAQIDTLRGNHLGALLKQLKLVDQQNFDQLSTEIKKLGTDFDDQLTKMKVGFTGWLLGQGDDDKLKIIADGFDGLQRRIVELAAAGDRVQIGKELESKIGFINQRLSDTKGMTDQIVRALVSEKDVLETQLQLYTAKGKQLKDQRDVIQSTYDKDENSRLDAQVAAWKKLNDEVDALMTATRALTGVDETEQEKVIHKIDEQIRKWKQLDDEIQRLTPGVKTYYGEEITALEARKRTIEAEIAQLQNGLLLDRFKQKGPDFAYASVKPTFAGTSDELELAKITADGPAAQAALQKVLDSVENVNQKFKQQSAILDELHTKYPDIFNTAMLKKAKDAIDPINAEWAKFGNSVQQTIISGQLFGSGWQAALRSIGVELLQLIIKMTLLKNLSGGAGAGGFSFSGLLSGLVGHAGGGRMYAGEPGIIGEKGPEIFIPDTSGTVLTNNALRSMMNGGAGSRSNVTNNNVELHLHGVTDADSFRKSADQTALELAGAVSRASRRNG